MTNRTLWLILALVFALPECSPAQSNWPKMREFDDSFPVDTNAERIDFVKPLYDVNGMIKYLFVCRGGGEKYLDELERDRNIIYVGILGCRLSEGDKEIEYSLLAEDEVAPWHTRGQFHNFNEVVGDCGNYPEYGRIRHFRLRGFELTLSATDMAYAASNQLQSFTMRITLRQDDQIASSHAEQPGYLTPYAEGRNCRTILRGNETRMCRNWEKGGSWEPCKD